VSRIKHVSMLKSLNSLFKDLSRNLSPTWLLTSSVCNGAFFFHMVSFFLCTLLCLCGFPGRWTSTAHRCIGRIVFLAIEAVYVRFYGSSIVGSGDYIGLYVFSVDVFLYLFYSPVSWVESCVVSAGCTLCVCFEYASGWHLHYPFSV
jgi:hypothetical protein